MDAEDARSSRGNRALPPPDRKSRAGGRAALIAAGGGGFTLVELVIVVAVMAILATVAYPSYAAYKVRANRAAAQAFLMDLANRQLQYFLNARAYSPTLSGLGVVGVPPEVATYYTVTAPTVDNSAAPPTFTVSAIARAQTLQAADGDLSINSIGVKSGHW